MPYPIRSRLIHSHLSQLTNLLVEIKMRQRQLNRLPNLLFLHIQASNIGIGDIRFFISAEHRYGRVGFRW